MLTQTAHVRPRRSVGPGGKGVHFRLSPFHQNWKKRLIQTCTNELNAGCHPIAIRSKRHRAEGGKEIEKNSQGTGQLDRCTWSWHTRIPGEFQCRPVSVSRPRLRPLSQVADFAVGIIQESSFLNKRITFCFLFSSSWKKKNKVRKWRRILIQLLARISDSYRSVRGKIKAISSSSKSIN